MTNTPLSSSEQSKVVIFTLLVLPPVFIFLGIIPIIFLVFGVLMMRKNSDFSHIETAARNIRGYLYIFLVCGVISVIYFGVDYFTCLGDRDFSGNFKYRYLPNCNSKISLIYISLIYPIASVFYLVITQKLFLNPLRNHRDWVERNGIFSNKEKPLMSKSDKSEINIVRGENKSYSVADELMKWAKLKEDGHITEQEFNEARKKLLQGD